MSYALIIENIINSLLVTIWCSYGNVPFLSIWIEYLYTLLSWASRKPISSYTESSPKLFVSSITATTYSNFYGMLKHNVNGLWFDLQSRQPFEKKFFFDLISFMVKLLKYLHKPLKHNVNDFLLAFKQFFEDISYVFRILETVKSRVDRFVL